MRLNPVFLSLAVLASASAAPVQDVSGTISDWTAGETGEVQLYVGHLAPNNLDVLQALGTAKVDAGGKFSLKLPDASAVKAALLPAKSELKLNVPCDGTLKMEPATALNFFDLAGYDSFGLRITTMRLSNTRMYIARQGDSFGVLAYAEKPTHLTGDSRCEPLATGQRSDYAVQWHWNAHLKAGWNLLSVLVTEQQGGVFQAKVTEAALPASDAWSLFLGSGGLDTYAEGMQDGRVRFGGIKPGSAAAKAGLQDGDIVLEINGVSTKGWDNIQVASKVRGDPGTRVTLKVLRGDKEVTLEATREFRRRN